MSKISYKKLMQGTTGTTKLLVTEAVGYGVAGKIAGDVDTAVGNHVATGAFSTGSALAGVPSLMYASGNVLGAVNSLYGNKKRRK